MKKNHNRLWIVTFVCLCLCLTSTISAMQMGGFDIDVGNGENSSWQWHEEQQWNQSSWENTWENNRQTGDNTSETPAQNDQTQDNGYQYDSDCEQADTGLRKLQKQCTEKEESRKILQILAVNSEYQENYENAGFYYEQMLLYDETYRAGYGEYGMFLFRTGQKEAGQALWTEYKSKETMLDDTVSRNLRLWEKEMTKSEEKS